MHDTIRVSKSLASAMCTYVHIVLCHACRQLEKTIRKYRHSMLYTNLGISVGVWQAGNC